MIAHFMLATAALTLVIAARYFLFSGLAYWLLWQRGGERLKAQRLNRDRPLARAIRREMELSLVASCISAVPTAAAFVAWSQGGTRVYTTFNLADAPYFLVSIALYLLIQDTYYYWLHRGMHHPKLFATMHAGHHRARQPTPFSSFAFDPAEALATAWLLPALVFFIPIHPAALLFIVTLMTVAAVMNHSGWEMLPRRWIDGWFGRHIITATHHDVHHAHYGRNFGLYFRFWDRALGTDTMPGDVRHRELALSR